MENYIIILGTKIEGKGRFACFVGQKAIATGYNADSLCKLVSSLAGGSGGGKPDYAEGGCKDGSRVEKAIDDIKQIIKETKGFTEVENSESIISGIVKNNEKE